MASYDLYGAASSDLDGARTCLETALTIVFEPRNSTYHGGNYFRCGKSEGENFILKRNVDPFDNEPAELDFPDSQLLLYVNKTLRPLDIQEVIRVGDTGFMLLQREEA